VEMHGINSIKVLYKENIHTYEIQSIYFKRNILYLHIGYEVFVTYPSYHAFLKIATKGDRNLQVFDGCTRVNQKVSALLYFRGKR